MLSLVFWSITLVVSVKYVSIVMRADNAGEGGVMALAALGRRALRRSPRAAAAVLVVAVIGASLFYGDSVITPAISVLSAVEGLEVAAPDLEHLVLPIAITILTVLFAAQRWGTGRIGALFGPVTVLWFATAVFLLMTTWHRGRELVQAKRTAAEGPLRDFIEKVHTGTFVRVPGTAVFPHPGTDTTPLALRAILDHNHVLHEHVVIVSTEAHSVPHVPADQQLVVDGLGYDDDGIVHVTLRHGFFDRPDIPAALARAADAEQLEGPVDPAQTSYFVSRGSLEATRAPGMSRWRKALFVALAHNAADPAERFNLPEDDTVVMGRTIEI